MGRSTTSCFNIISCGCINQSSENKDDDKPGWSFGKKSARRQVPSNAVVTEKIPATESKEILEPITIRSEPQISSNISEKTSDNIWIEETPDSITKNAAVLTMATEPASEEDSVKCDPVPDESESEYEYESAVLVIQAAVRRFLAERQWVKHKNVVKLQAAVRGHLVRNHAVGTLRCVQAIVKMQALVRARREKGMQNAGINSTPTHISIEKLLSNKLARQLLESTPKTKQISIKCDPSKSDSAWNWLERWMSVSSPETLQSHTPDHVQDKVVNNTESEVKMVISANNFGEATVRFEQKENLTILEENANVKAHEESVVIPVSETKPKLIPEDPVSETKPKLIPEDPVSETKPKVIPEDPVSETKPIPENPVSETKPKLIPEDLVSETKPKLIPEDLVSETKPKPENTVSETKAKLIPKDPVSETKTKLIPEDPVSETKPIPISENPVSETELNTEKQIATDQPNSEGGKNVFGSRKASNPAFIAAQSRFEELTSPKTNPMKLPNFSTHDDEPGLASGSPADISSSYLQKVPDNEATDPVSETELSVTSILDSPDHVETENKKTEEVKVVENHDDSDIEPELEAEFSHHVDKSNDHEPIVHLSGSESPRSHITNLESQGTPSSQISTNSKKTKADKKVSSQTQPRKSWSYSKKSSPVSPSVDSGLKSSLEQLPKDPKPGKRRNVFGSPKPDTSDHDSVPSYMQATESARAKAVANSSPRSSPDVHDKETNLKKRHSLPGVVNARQGSPRVQRSMSLALQTTKGNGNQERKWQR